MKNLHWAVGSLAMLSFVACSKEERPPRTAETSPTFESSVTESNAQPGMNDPNQLGSQGSEMGTSGQLGQPGALGASPNTGIGDPNSANTGSSATQPGSAGLGAQGSMGLSGTDTANMKSHKELCDALSQNANLRVEDIQDGVAIVVTPKTGNDLSSIRDHVQGIERGMGQGAQMQAGDTTNHCALFDVTGTGARATISEEAKAMRILITTTDTANSKNLRKQVRDAVKNIGKSGAAGTQGNLNNSGNTDANKKNTTGGTTTTPR